MAAAGAYQQPAARGRRAAALSVAPTQKQNNGMCMDGPLAWHSKDPRGRRKLTGLDVYMVVRLLYFGCKGCLHY